ncbi:hypothetical protein AB0M54_39870 [Actinoplanes sp. NPDC051470]|uniref:hypothetical protein n=1 Tax=unclassified Actinoplanes TaxID=2626549 RepID=UPI00341F36D7
MLSGATGGLTVPLRQAAVQTTVNGQRLRDVGALISFITDEHKAAIADLGKVAPNAGAFDAAQWVRDLFIDRRDAVATHLKYLETAFKEINEGLIAIAKEFEGVDMTNSDAVARATAASKNIITEMGKAEYQPVMSKSKPSYETGDDSPTNDEDSFDFANPKDPKILDFDPAHVPGMGQFMTPGGLGKNNDSVVNLNEQPDLKSNQSMSLQAAPPPPATGTPPPPVTAAPPPATGTPPPPVTAAPPPATGEHFSKTEPVEGGTITHNSNNDDDYQGRTYRYYEIDGHHQTDAKGREVWWLNGKPYIKQSSKPVYVAL